MDQNNTSSAGRLKKPSWKDPRLLIGLLLVLVSVSGVIAVVGSADKTTPMFSAREPIAVGQQVTRDDLKVVNVRLDEVEPEYMAVADGLTEGKVALQRIEKDQLVPRRSLGQTESLNRKPVAISVEEPLPVQVVAGARVDVWVAMPGSKRAYDQPTLLLPGAEISQVTPGSTTLGGSKATVVLVLVTDQQMPALLGAQANAAKVSVVWNPSGVGR
ncbi:SAF domain-containing protein [Paenarthrobacter sp. NPDC089714]|uniref:SAF domain-containing protein n=1 Tax=Paenarthrobacter sp. NPDC089714 TaxID=3364377 RepID=UPI0037FA6571